MPDPAGGGGKNIQRLSGGGEPQRKNRKGAAQGTVAVPCLRTGPRGSVAESSGDILMPGVAAPTGEARGGRNARLRHGADVPPRRLKDVWGYRIPVRTRFPDRCPGTVGSPGQV